MHFTHLGKKSVIPLVILGLFKNIGACANAGALTMDGALVTWKNCDVLFNKDTNDDAVK